MERLTCLVGIFLCPFFFFFYRTLSRLPHSAVPPLLALSRKSLERKMTILVETKSRWAFLQAAKMSVIHYRCTINTPKCTLVEGSLKKDVRVFQTNGQCDSFNSIDQLKSRPAHLAAFLHYVISLFEPAPVVRLSSLRLSSVFMRPDIL